MNWQRSHGDAIARNKMARSPRALEVPATAPVNILLSTVDCVVRSFWRLAVGRGHFKFCPPAA